MNEKKKDVRRGRPRGGDRHKPFKNLRVPDDLYSRLEAVADANDREIAREGRRALIAHIESEEKRLGIKSPGG